MGDEDKEKKSVIETFGLSGLLNPGAKYEAEQFETSKKGTVSDGDISTIYTMLQQGMRMAGNTPPKNFTWTAVREHYQQ